MTPFVSSRRVTALWVLVVATALMAMGCSSSAAPKSAMAGSNTDETLETGGHLSAGPRPAKQAFDGKPAPFRSVTTFQDMNTQLYQMYASMNGKEMLIMEITYTREPETAQK